jgi:UDP-N-acetylmuramoyl-L-alanyl-D-glutamate--2,6-diaminopimelate ligase
LNTLSPITERPLRGARSFIAGGSSQLLQRAARRPASMNLRLEQLFSGLPDVRVEGDARRPVHALCSDSRRVTPGAVFFALPGARTNGGQYIEEAVHRGAIAVVAPTSVWVPRTATLIVAPAIRRTLALCSRRFYGSPQDKLQLTGVAGTSGKTVVGSLARHFLEAGEAPVGFLGTINYALGARTLPAYRTTPEPIDMHAMLAQMVEGGAKEAILEVSSHGIDQERVFGLDWDSMVFTNLYGEHLDYHGSLENYYAVVKRAFDGSLGKLPRRAIVNIDDAWGRRLLGELHPDIERITFGTSAEARFRASEIECGPDGTRFTLRVDGETFRVFSPLPGRFNVDNLLAALAATAHRVPTATALGRLIDFDGVRGRTEVVDVGQAFHVVVDYAHTPGSYAKTLEMLRSLTKGRVLTVFGCGGDRDVRQRPLIARTVADLSDMAWATADNPRGETLEGIFADIRSGLRVKDPVTFIDDRRQAISLALDAAAPGDIVLIAGKGHETFQEYADSIVPFDDRAVARELLRKKMGVET